MIGLPMNELATFLQPLERQSEEVTVWGGGQCPLRVVSYFCETLPPLAYVTSVRGVVLHQDEVLVLRNTDELHIMPGGRREANESLAETLRREVIEETGWLTADYHLLGCLHFYHLTPKPANFPYLYPDFVHLVYRAQAVQYLPDQQLPDDYEIEARLVSIAQAMQLPFQQRSQLTFLAQALMAVKR